MFLTHTDVFSLTRLSVHEFFLHWLNIVKLRVENGPGLNASKRTFRISKGELKYRIIIPLYNSWLPSEFSTVVSKEFLVFFPFFFQRIFTRKCPLYIKKSDTYTRFQFFQEDAVCIYSMDLLT